MAEIAKTVSEDYERGFKDGLKSECLKELKPFMVGLAKGCIEAIKGISPMLIDNAQLTIRHAVNRWISVHDMLPTEGMDVLICNFDEWCKIASYHGNHWEDDHGRCVPEYEITHWQELPEPPKEGADNGN